jgi:excisionase family DNA binding protein
MRSATETAVLTIDDLAEYLKISKSTLYKLAQEEAVPGQKVGRHWRFHPDAVDQWLRKGSSATPKSPKRRNPCVRIGLTLPILVGDLLVLPPLVKPSQKAHRPAPAPRVRTVQVRSVTRRKSSGTSSGHCAAVGAVL